MRKLTPLLAFASSLTFAQSMTVAYDFGLKEGANIANEKAHELTNVLGLGFNLDVDVFAGVTWKSKTPLGGGLLGKRVRLADQAQGYAGIGVSIAQGQSWSPVVCAGVTVKF